ncbi:MAG: hypothetical protein M5U19_02450 [Microthrixaceae bacterium]|nr:hypothetical protein [Microthrixaceae bacterium]
MTTTSNFGVSTREGHDSSAFYARFRPPVLSDEDTVLEPVPIADPFFTGDARRMDAIADGSVALVVTSRRTSRASSTRRSWNATVFPPPTSNTSNCSGTCSPNACASSNQVAASP